VSAGQQRLDASRPLTRTRRRFGEDAIRLALGGCALVSVVTTVGIVIALLLPAVEFFGEVDPRDFLFGTDWAPLFSPSHFGVLPLVAGTLVVTVCACLVALPLGLGVAIYLAEYASRRVHRIVKPLLEILAGIPTVVYGYFALTSVTPLLRHLGLGVEVFNALSAGLVMGVMLLPTVASLSEDALAAVPQALRQGGYALGANRLQVSLRIAVPAALSGIVASFVLAISRAVGETMIVTIAAGLQPTLTLDPRVAVETLTAFIASTAGGDVPTGSIEYKTIFAVGLALFVATLILNTLAIRLVRRFREVYE
jgi:phosphate transport system permease protein